MDPVNPESQPLPVAFIGHGSPMLALEGGSWSPALRRWASTLQGVRGVLVASAHWETGGAFKVTSSRKPGVIHDFSGFDEALYHLDYPSPGDPVLAARVIELLRTHGMDALLDTSRSLDHGAWVPLRSLWPEAELPVLQISLPRPRTPDLLLQAGRALAPLRSEGILIVGSGGLVHNLQRLAWQGNPPPEAWAEQFEAWVIEALHDQDLERLKQAADRAPGYSWAVPTSEHFDPLYFVLGAGQGAAPSAIHQGWQHGNLSLAAYAWSHEPVPH